ncbi:hypothetical protein B0T16DRAFT_239568 [Cercophora newfieldiana]|uniref:Transmembrane protein n=1 Tax=Cercophora newfieldiana TaxID=92897 RepID=A0AA40CJD3_9PEZI|nr:hypothetical protein B0T16DRAFT_239568 [Cercophora newfieldiana]
MHRSPLTSFHPPDNGSRQPPPSFNPLVRCSLRPGKDEVHGDPVSRVLQRLTLCPLVATAFLLAFWFLTLSLPSIFTSPSLSHIIGSSWLPCGRLRSVDSFCSFLSITQGSLPAGFPLRPRHFVPSPGFTLRRLCRLPFSLGADPAQRRRHLFRLSISSAHSNSCVYS